MINLDDEQYEGMLVAVGLDEAIIGTASVWGNPTDVFVYSVQCVLNILMTRDGMGYDEAREFFDFNIAGAYIGEQTPVWVEDIVGE